MLIVVAGRRRLKDRGIKWDESYHERSAQMKKHFDKKLPNSYFRWEGHDYESGHPYYVIVGPAESRRQGKSFFAGVKKMPLDKKKKAYSPSGKYFYSLKAALSYAQSMWGIPYPKVAGNYNSKDLSSIKIPRHVKGMEKA